jgi:hypothetical protein
VVQYFHCIQYAHETTLARLKCVQLKCVVKSHLEWWLRNYEIPYHYCFMTLPWNMLLRRFKNSGEVGIE